MRKSLTIAVCGVVAVGALAIAAAFWVNGSMAGGVPVAGTTAGPASAPTPAMFGGPDGSPVPAGLEGRAGPVVAPKPEPSRSSVRYQRQAGINARFRQRHASARAGVATEPAPASE